MKSREVSASQLDEPIALSQVIMVLAGILAEVLWSTAAKPLDGLRG